MAVAIQILGLSDYAEVHALQRQLVTARAAGEVPDVLLLLEHAATITVGRKKAAQTNVLDAQDIPVVEVERGGDVTWHGPGQLVSYPIIQLEGVRADLHRHLHNLEDAVMGLLQDYGLKPTRDDRNTGVWLPRQGSDPQKVCSIGIACRRWVTWHGLALNVTPAPQAFHAIHPCGFDASIMTRLAEHLNPPPSVQAMAAPLARHLSDSLEVPLEGSMRYCDSPEEVRQTLGLAPA